MFDEFINALKTAWRMHQAVWHPPILNLEHMNRVRGIVKD